MDATPQPPVSRYSGFEEQFINGAWRPGRSTNTLDDTNPYNNDLLAHIILANRSDLDNAYDSAAMAQASWASAPPAERADVLLRALAIMEARHDEIVDWLVGETGSTRITARWQCRLLNAVTREAASFPYRDAGRILSSDIAGKDSRAYRQPLGVIGVISPWTLPIYLSNRAVAPAIALGNAVVLKPAQDTPVTGGLLLAKIYEEAGLPPGILNVVVASRSELGDAFVTHPVPRLIVFTGSASSGRHIAQAVAAASTIKRLLLELGGNSPFIVLDDAHIDRALPAAVWSRFLHQGQISTSANRFIVDTRLYDEFVYRFKEHAGGLKHGDPADEDTVIGPLINARQLDRMKACIQSAHDAGARQVLGGEPDGLVLPPQVFADVTGDMPIARMDAFGPVAAIIKVTSEEEALRIANDTEHGLSSAVFTRDEGRGARFALALHAGMTHINDGTVDDHPDAPFGGEKNSGIGRYGGEWAIREFTTDHWLTAQRIRRQYAF
ncbi:aldehyde dehydrogenase family protein [Noviherbaspirillum cavernae]|uniref:Aldehyde dehydrogenase family protein n=1 Tax=Noviherbaspirillum cavernae TaxID=2320862 RepID=A0A418X0Y2_9BURK|nr:aldehyde dehydrogenase family protein [Noviherbaspirillum cavernae]RJG06101.1 aldehyde dehydrogenase family protein [Noviherbaspirillum cavernae]